MVISGQELVNIASEIVSTVEGASGLGIEYEDVVDIICELLIEKLDLTLDSIKESFLDRIDKSSI